jgi:medium-chain acyl-[acyl-carrier-protein] hydrolase
VPALVERVVAAIAGFLDKPYAVFGHSMGALLAAEVARDLASRGLPRPFRLFVSGRRAPQIPDPYPPISHLPDNEFVNEINQRYGGIPSQILNSPDILELLLPCLRADITAVETFRAPAPNGRAPLDCPITAFGGLDDAQTPRTHLEAWRELTSAAFELRMFPGGHFYLEAQRAVLLAEMSATLRPLTLQAAPGERQAWV